MKRYGNLWYLVTDIDNIKLAHLNARKGKTNYTEVQAVDRDPDKYAFELQQMLLDKTFKCSAYEIFEKIDKGKVRVIQKLPYFPDRIVQHALLQVLEPIWKKTLIANTHQAIKGRGVHTCLHAVKHAVHTEKQQYCLQMDVAKFYPSIDNTLLKEVLRFKIKCPDTLWLLDLIVDSSVGVPIGNYISQYFGNLYLSELDHLLKEELRIKYYYRYCDDMILLSDSKQELWEAMAFTEAWLSKWNLKLKHNYQVYKITERRGVGCLGYIVTPSRIKLRRSIVVAFVRKLKSSATDSYGSYYGWFKHCNSIGLWRALVHNNNCPAINRLTIKLKVYNAKSRKQYCP